MQNYKDTNDGVHALSDTDIANGGLNYLPDGCIEITQAQADALTAPTPTQLWQTYQSTAQDALDEGDMVAIRCAKAGVAYPAAWLARDFKLRAIVSATSGDPTIALSANPPYPTGT
jgi:hypothetical protein